MGRRRRLIPVPAAIALIAALGASPWAGTPITAEPRDEDLFVRPEDQRTVLFGSLDAGRSVFVGGGAKQTLTGPLDRSGFVLSEWTGFGITRERFEAGGASYGALRISHETSVTPGIQWSFGRVFVSGFVGPEVREQQVLYDGHIDRISQPRLGVRGQVEIWSNPSADTLLTGTVVTGTARPYLYARVSGGIATLPNAFVGPEITLYETPTYREVRLGAHVTGLTVGLVHLRASAGWVTDDSHRRGAPYTGLSAWIRL